MHILLSEIPLYVWEMTYALLCKPIVYKSGPRSLNILN